MPVYLHEPHDRIVGTLKLLLYLKRFLASDCVECVDPIARMHGWRSGFYLNKEQARRQLHWLIDVAINRKAGLPDVRDHRDTPDYLTRLRRDYWRLIDIRQRRIRVYQFETPEVRRRFKHLLSRYDD